MDNPASRLLPFSGVGFGVGLGVGCGTGAATGVGNQGKFLQASHSSLASASSFITTQSSQTISAQVYEPLPVHENGSEMPTRNLQVASRSFDGQVRSTHRLEMSSDFSAAARRKVDFSCSKLVPSLECLRIKRGPPLAPHGMTIPAETQTQKIDYLAEAKRLLRESRNKKTMMKFPTEAGRVAVRFDWRGHTEGIVFLAGSFNGWGLPISMSRKGQVWSCVLQLKDGSYDYAYVVDGSLTVDKARPRRIVKGKGYVNWMVVGKPSKR